MMTTIQKLIDIDFSKLSIQLKSHYKSSVWQHFGYLILNEDGNSIVVSNDVYCNLCFQQNKLHCYKHSSSSSNLQRHLILCHNVDLASESESKSITNQHIIKIDDPYLSVIKIEPKTEETNSTEHSDAPTQQHGKLKTFLNNNLVINLALLCCKDQLPFNILNGAGFQQFLINSGIVTNKSQIPSPTEVLQETISNIYNSLLQIVISSFSDAEQTLALTLEKWNEGESTYRTWRFLFCNGMFEQLTMTMPTIIKKCSSEKQDVVNEIDNFCQLLKLKNKSIIMIDEETVHSEESSLATSNSFKLHRHYCISHALNDMVNIDGLSKVLKSSSLSKNLYKQLKSQNVGEIESLKQAYNNLENYLESLSKKSTQRHFISWNALIVLLEFVDKSFNQPGCSTLHDIMTEENIAEFNQLLSFLKHIQEALEILNGTPYTSCALVLLLRAEMQRLLNMSEDDCKLLKSLKKNMADVLPQKFPITDLHVCASLLDPSQRGWTSIQDYLAGKRTTFVEFLTSMLKKFCVVDKEDGSELSEASSELGKTQEVGIADNPESKSKPSESQTSGNEPPWKKAKLEILARHVTSSESSKVEREFQQYMFSFLSKESCDEPLLWWKERRETFPKLSELARIILIIPAGCSSMENISKLTERAEVSKLSLRDDDLVKMLFVRNNSHMIEVTD